MIVTIELSNLQLTDFSEKRMKAIKGDLKRGVYGSLFYTHEFGYLMVPIVYPNGDGGGELNSALIINIYVLYYT